jgi:hypothetical protein
MGQSIGSVGNTHKQAGAGDQKHGQHETAHGQKVSDQGGGKAAKRDKPDGGADHGARSAR